MSAFEFSRQQETIVNLRGALHKANKHRRNKKIILKSDMSLGRFLSRMNGGSKRGEAECPP